MRTKYIILFIFIGVLLLYSGYLFELVTSIYSDNNLPHRGFLTDILDVFSFILVVIALLFPIGISMALYSRVKEIHTQEKRQIEENIYSKSEVKDFKGVIDDYDKLIELDPKHAQGYYYRGNAKFQLDDKVGARLDLVSAYELGLWSEYYDTPPDYVLELFADERLGIPINNYDRWY